ncbi:MAG: PTS sugar transporter subunit IIA [Phycisphaerae bacterium]|nr:PTS sugar transporter subunit IIA [Phycisphaerae bacterium]
MKVPLQGKTKNAVISELIDLLTDNGMISDKKVASEAVFNREKTRSTGIGSGIAIPHGKCKAVKELVMAMGLTAEPVDFDSVDDKPVRIVILLISPLDQTGPHIQALARISRLLLDEPFKQMFEQAATAEQAYSLLTRKEAE